MVKALYGLRHAPPACYAIDCCLKKMGVFKYLVYTKRYGNKGMIIGVYIDDSLVTGTYVHSINLMKKQMEEKFQIRDLGKL